MIVCASMRRPVTAPGQGIELVQRVATVPRPSAARLQPLLAAAPSANIGIAPSGSTPLSDAAAKSTQRVGSLQTKILLRKLYRNLLRAEPLLLLPSPVYQPPEEGPALDPDAANTVDLATAAAAAADELQRRIDNAVEVVAEMELTAEELKLGMRALKASPVPLASVVKSDAPSLAEPQVAARVQEVYAALVERVTQEIKALPFPSPTAAQAAMEARNSRYRVPGTPLPAELAAAGNGNDSDGGAPEGGYLPPEQRRGLGERLEEAERVAERFVARRLQPAVARVRETSPEGVIEGVQSSAVWLRGVWDRLNGSSGSAAAGAPPAGLPPAASTEADRAAIVEALNAELEELEARLQEASKARETRLRKAGIQGRARMAAELRQMDNEVAVVSRALAVRTLQLEMEFICGCLEAEALDVLGDPAAAAAGSPADRIALALSRRGSSDEIALLAAEFGQLDGALAALTAAVEGGEGLYIDDSDLAQLATEIPDLRVRLGVGDTLVFGGTGWSVTKVQMQMRQSVGKVADGVGFGVRGVRLLAADVASAGGLFWRALLGGTLRPREVQALRRTAKDVLTFIPVTVILILPLTPVGHVLIFGFIQRYFPGFFPSQFTTRRQELMMKYEELKQQLTTAQMAAERESDELEFRRAAAALERTAGAAAAAAEAVAAAAETAAARESHGSGDGSGAAVVAAAGQGGDDDDDGEGPAAAVVRKLEEQLAAAADSSYTGTDAEES